MRAEDAAEWCRQGRRQGRPEGAQGARWVPAFHPNRLDPTCQKYPSGVLSTLLKLSTYGFEPEGRRFESCRTYHFCWPWPVEKDLS